MVRLIGLGHGSGGEATRSLIEHFVADYLANPVIERLDDSAVIDLEGTQIAFTTDSYVIDPVFFPGGDIGCLAVYGTVNDLAMVGAKPIALTLSLIIEEGFPIDDLESIMASIRIACEKAGVIVVGGDTKVVEHGSADKIFINTSGIGIVPKGLSISSCQALPGDAIILSGTIGDHGIAVLSKRQGLCFKSQIESDTCPLSGLVQDMLRVTRKIHAMRDPTRGGLASLLNEIALKSAVGIVIDEDLVPIRPEVRSACDMLGLDPFYVANEGKLVAFVDPQDAEKLLEEMRKHELARQATLIGWATDQHPKRVVINTSVGGKRFLAPLSGELLPRIC